eukprot:8196628-Pyramimonas_sp.AAC.1
MAEQGMSWPWQLLTGIGRLLAKRGGGDRVIGLVTMICRVWSMAREEQMRQWSSDSAPHWDAA